MLKWIGYLLFGVLIVCVGNLVWNVISVWYVEKHQLPKPDWVTKR